MPSFTQTFKHKDFPIWMPLMLVLFLVLYLAESVEESMFVDGLWYASISRNLAEGVGSFWSPQFSATIFSNFHEHPPLWFGLQSLFFQLLGDSFLTERIFSLGQYLMTASILVLLWKIMTKKLDSAYQKYWLIPLLLWQTNLLAYYFLPANLLDSGIALLDLVVILLLYAAFQNNQYWKVGLAAFVLLLAFLTKGLVALFPLAFPTFYVLVFRNRSIKWLIKMTGFLLLGFCLLLSGLYFFNAAAADSLQQYFDIQVMASLTGERRLYYYRPQRWYILGQLTLTLMPMILTTLFFRISNRKASKKSDQSAVNRIAVLFLLTGLSASLPIMISPRQALPYLLPSLPYFCLAFSLWLIPGLEGLMNFLRKNNYALLRLAEKVNWLMVLLSILWVVQKYGQTNQRDAQVISDAKKIGAYVGKSQIIASQTYDMYISGYLMRFDKVSLDTLNLDRSFLLTKRHQALSDSSFVEIPLSMKMHRLYQKRERLSGIGKEKGLHEEQN
jgi:4-amino-4-deoxy-L-arabinose transferase and related glycosyltransferases of PMT family